MKYHFALKGVSIKNEAIDAKIEELSIEGEATTEEVQAYTAALVNIITMAVEAQQAPMPTFQ